MLPRWIWVGLGNPGPAYQFTRHNFGFLVLDYWAKEEGTSFEQVSKDCELAKLEDVLLVKPLTFMNLSGRCVGPLVKHLGVSPSYLLLVHDDLDLPLGRMKFSPGGGAGGHNGVKSVIEALGTKDFPRLKLGIGRPPQGMPVKDYVLSPFTEEEWAVVEEVVLRAKEALDCLRTQGLEKTMSLYNRR